MLLKKPAVIFSSFNTISSFSAPSNPAPSSHVCTIRGVKRQRRSYASVQDEKEALHHDYLSWPELGDPPRPPSPYQIFHQQQDEPYSKRRFYELVKIYHPDRTRHATASGTPPITGHASPSVMLERYRMVIAANSILSDPAKREAYDKFGHGWSHIYGEESSHGRYAYKYGTYHRWRRDGTATYQWPVDEDPMFNATWEDWERWYEKQFARRSGHPFSSSFFSERRRRQGTIYANNYAFISVIFLLAALGGAGQATRANEGAKSRLARAQAVNDETNKVLMEARQNTRDHGDAGGTKDERIRRFLSQSDDYERGEFDGRALRQGDNDLCAPGLVKDANEPRFWEKPPESG